MSDFNSAVERLGAALRAKLQRDAGLLPDKVETNERFGKFVGISELSKLYPTKLYELDLSARGLTGSQLAAVSNKARQRRKGPLVRFGRKYL